MLPIHVSDSTLLEIASPRLYFIFKTFFIKGNIVLQTNQVEDNVLQRQKLTVLLFTFYSLQNSG